MARRVVLGAVLVGLGARLAFGLFYWVGKPLTHDELEYLSLGRSLAAGRGFVYDNAIASSERFGRAPGYPLFLSLITRLVGDEADDSGQPSERMVAAVKIAQSVAGALGVWIAALLAARIAGSTAGAVAASVAALYPPLVWIGAYVLSEAVYSPLALWNAYLFCPIVNAGELRRRGKGADDRHSPAGRLLLCGAVAGLATLMRPIHLFFLLLGALWLVRARRLAAVLWLLVGAAIVIAPWTIRNVLTYDRLVLVASEGGITFWTGNHPLARGEGDLAANVELKRANQTLRNRYAGLSAEQLEPVYYREAFEYIRSHPLDWIILLGRKVFYLVVPLGPSYTLHSRLYFLTSVASYLLVLPFAVLGIIAIHRRGTPPIGLWLLGGSAILAAIVFFPQERFRIPVLDPLMIVAGSAWWNLRRSASGPGSPLGARPGISREHA